MSQEMFLETHLVYWWRIKGLLDEKFKCSLEQIAQRGLTAEKGVLKQTSHSREHNVKLDHQDRWIKREIKTDMQFWY